MSRTKQIWYLIALLCGAVFVLVYRGIGWVIVRSYLGDVLIVQFIYLIGRFWIKGQRRYLLAGAVLLLGIGTELFQLLAAGSIPRTAVAELTVGSTFDVVDILAYALGITIILLADRPPALLDSKDRQ